ncbi:MAG: EamA family transporter [Chloroflexi bacterium]|nr:EamA family transporter [Chloroflexota bacterium]
MRPSHLAVLVLLSTLWGSAFMLVRVVLDEVPPLTLVAGRLTGAFAFLAVALLLTGRSLPIARWPSGQGRGPKPWQTFLLLGVVNNVFPFSMLTWGQQHIESSLAAILVASMPLSTAMLAHYWADERLTIDRTLGVLVGFGGVFVLIGGDLGDLTASSTLGQLAIVGGVLGYSFGTVYARRYLQDADSLVVAAGQTLVGAAIMAPIALAVDRPFDLTLEAKTVFAWLTLGLLSSALAYLLFFWLIRRVTATQVSMVAYLIPITAVILGALVLDERLGVSSFAGLGVIILGVWIVNGGGSWLASRVRGGGEPAVG